MEFPTNKKQQETIGACSKEPTVGLLYDDKDNDRVERFKYSFPEIHCIIIGMNSEKKSEKETDYILVFISLESMKNVEFLEVFLNIYERKDRKVCGIIIDDELRDVNKRIELYRYYKRKIQEIWNLRNELGSNADIRRCVDIYERSYERIAEYFVEILKNAENKKICAEAQFEAYLKKDGRKVRRKKRSEENNYEIVKSGEEHMGNKTVNNTYNIKTDQLNVIEKSNNNTIVQKNGIKKEDFEVICEAIQKSSNVMDRDNAEKIQGMLDEIKKEFEDFRNQRKEEPSGNRFKKCIDLAVKMLTLANGIPVLGDNLLKLQAFLISNMT